MCGGKGCGWGEKILPVTPTTPGKEEPKEKPAK